MRHVYDHRREIDTVNAFASCKLRGDGIYVTYNVNSFDFGEPIDNLNTYFLKFIRVKVTPK